MIFLDDINDRRMDGDIMIYHDISWGYHGDMDDINDI